MSGFLIGFALVFSFPLASEDLFRDQLDGFAGKIGTTPNIKGRTILSLLPMAVFGVLDEVLGESNTQMNPCPASGDRAKL